MSASPASSTAAVHWVAALDQIAQRLGQCFTRAEPRRRILAYLKGLLSPVPRKNDWRLAEQAGDPSPYGVQHLLGRAS
jgi:hypothetical protein